MKQKLALILLAILAIALASYSTANASLPKSMHAGGLRQAPPPRQAPDATYRDISYQGQLTDGGSPANGVYDFLFKLYDNGTLGSQQGSDVLKDDIVVTDGLFMVTLDFGLTVYDGGDRWVEVYVRPGASTGSYTKLDPRQRLTVAPYALVARSMPNGRGPVTIDNTYSPVDTALNIDGLPGYNTSIVLNNGSVNWDISAWEDNSFYITKLSGTTETPLKISENSPSNELVLGSSGVGINTDTPTHTLEVNGDVHASGKITSGPNNVSMPVAYGIFNQDGTTSSATPNLSAAWDAVHLRYEITLSGESYDWQQYVSIVTPAGCNACYAKTGAYGGKLLVYILDSAGTKVQSVFQLVIFKP